MPNHTRDEQKQAAEHCIAEGLCGGCPIWDTHGLRSFHECAAYAFRALLSAFEREEKECEWSEDGYEGGTWETSCGSAFCLMDGTPEENKMKHCPYCGGMLKQIAPGREDDDDEDAAIKAIEEGSK